MTYLLDADTVNYLLKGIPAVRERFRQSTSAGAAFVLSPMVHYQLTRYLKLKDARRVNRAYQRLIADWEWAPFEDADWDLAADIWASRHRVGLAIQDADLFIAVSALETELGW